MKLTEGPTWSNELRSNITVIPERQEAEWRSWKWTSTLATEPFLTQDVSNNIFSTITKYTLFLLNDIVASC